jgi:o-succinylbenzoate synthase
MLPIAELRAEPLDVALREPFGIATGAQHVAEIALVTLVLADGTVGLGEAAPFPAVNGETRAQALEAVHAAAKLCVGADARRWRRIAAELAGAIPGVPSARAAIEMALLDALCRRASLSLWTFFGAAERALETDITIPTGDLSHAIASAERARNDGFRCLKIKIGAATPEADALRVRAIASAAPEASLVLDANASLTWEQAVELAQALDELRPRIALFEQPTPAGDLDALAAVRHRTRIPIAADESARSAADVARIASAGAADVINVKITKSGVAEALDMIAAARAHDLGLMIGGMVETRLAMSVSACLAAGAGGFSFVDLDTPLFLAEDPFEGGFVQAGPRLEVSEIMAGHGVRRIAQN